MDETSSECPSLTSSSSGLNIKRRSTQKNYSFTEDSLIDKKTKALTSPQPIGQTAPKLWKNFITRFFWTILMILSFMAILWAGHIFVILMVIAIQIIVFKEVIDIAREPWHHNRLPWFRTISW